MEAREMEIREKSCSLLRGECGHIDDVLRFVSEKFKSGHGIGSIARMLGLTYDEFYDVLTHVRVRIRELTREKQSLKEAA
jgi:hypothetical protein